MHLDIARLVSILGRGWCIDDLRLRDDRIWGLSIGTHGNRSPPWTAASRGAKPIRSAS
jgi:hypothetical protein